MENEKITEGNSLVIELLTTLRVQIKRLWIALVVALVVIISVVFGFLWYLNQYEYVETIEQKGVYTLIDSQGNVITSDLNDEQIAEILEIMNNGESENTTETN